MQTALGLVAVTVESPARAATERIRAALEAAGARITGDRVAFETGEGVSFSFEIKMGVARLERVLDSEGVFLNPASRQELAEAGKRGEGMAGVLRVKVEDPEG